VEAVEIWTYESAEPITDLQGRCSDPADGQALNNAPVIGSALKRSWADYWVVLQTLLLTPCRGVLALRLGALHQTSPHPDLDDSK